MAFPHRCSRCKRRATFARRWNHYQVKKKCWRCGNLRFYVDKWMQRRGKEQACFCGGYHFPHRKKSKWCELNPKRDAFELAEREAWVMRWGGGSD